MYSRESIKKGVKNPKRAFEVALKEFNRVYNRTLFSDSSAEYNERGIDIVEEDWDTLITLDACRFDTFEDLAGDLPGTLRKVESKAPKTIQFLRANFSDKNLHDTVYVTANPQLYRVQNREYDVRRINVSFHSQIEVWQDNWDDNHRTVMPDVVTDVAKEAAEMYPNKRLIIHYLQPHAPYIGPTGTEEFPTEYLNFWKSFKQGKFDISLETARRAYCENLEAVLPHVADLLSELEGKTVVTADHGELLGERDRPIPIRRYGHLSDRYLPALIEVPWLEHEFGSRRDIVAEAPKSPEAGESDAKTVRNRLRDLGYTE
jgi:hypothetical protein